MIGALRRFLRPAAALLWPDVFHPPADPPILARFIGGRLDGMGFEVNSRTGSLEVPVLDESLGPAAVRPFDESRPIGELVQDPARIGVARYVRTEAVFRMQDLELEGTVDLEGTTFEVTVRDDLNLPVRVYFQETDESSAGELPIRFIFEREAVSGFWYFTGYVFGGIMATHIRRAFDLIETHFGREGA